TSPAEAQASVKASQFRQTLGLFSKGPMSQRAQTSRPVRREPRRLPRRPMQGRLQPADGELPRRELSGQQPPQRRRGALAVDPTRVAMTRAARFRLRPPVCYPCPLAPFTEDDTHASPLTSRELATHIP